MNHLLHIPDEGLRFEVPSGENLLAVLQQRGLAPDAPCGGIGTCGKCKVMVNGMPALACKTIIDRDMSVDRFRATAVNILTDSICVDTVPDGKDQYTLAFDIGTTTIAAYLLDGITGKLLSQSSTMNPQAQFGADVISRIQYAIDIDSDALSHVVISALRELTLEAAHKAKISPEEITAATVVGNTAMHHLLLQIDPKPLTTPPYMPSVSHALVLPATKFLPIHPEALLRVLPNIAGFVGADTVGCMVATRFDQLEEMTLMIDIGTNGEMVLGNRSRRIACSTAAGPAFEGAKIQCGMRGAVGAIDHVTLMDHELCWSVIGGGKPTGLCGSGLLDLIAALLARGDIDETGRMNPSLLTLNGTSVFLTQKDVREVQLAKAAIRAGIELMCKTMGITPHDIQKVLLAGAFGNYLNPASACAIGMIPPCLESKIQSVGNAAGEGAKLCALSNQEFEYSKALAKETEFLELASMPEFNDCYVDCLTFEEE